MEQFFDYKMVDDRSVVEQAHEIQSLAKELEHFPCVLPDKFVAGGIIAKLLPAWRGFATSLKHKRQEFNVADLIGTVDVEEKASAKDTRKKGVAGSSSANKVQKNNSLGPHKNKRKKPQTSQGVKPKTAFKKKKNNNKGNCFVCGQPGHFASECQDRKYRQNKKSANVVIGENKKGTAGAGGVPPC